jgi:hypothetical protein
MGVEGERANGLDKTDKLLLATLLLRRRYANGIITQPRTVKLKLRPCHSSGGYSPASHRGGPGFDPRSGLVGFVVDKVALGQVFSEYFGLPCQFSFHRLLHIHHRL